MPERQVDHIQVKANQGMESLKNLWVLCPNCHAKKTCGMIAVDLKAKKVTEGDTEIKPFLRQSSVYLTSL